MLCKFTAIVATSEGKTRYQCRNCGRMTSLTIRPPGKIHATCGLAEDQHWIICPHRGPPVGEINARTAGCGCASSTVEVYECGVFREAVLLHSPARCVEAVAEFFPAYAGRSCRGCQIPSKPAPTA